MFIVKKHVLLTLVCLALITVRIDSPYARQDNEKGKTEGGEKSSPSLAIKASSVQIAPDAAPAGQAKTSESGKNNSAGGAQPHIVVDASDYDAGEIWENETLIHTFVVRNTGTAQLDITQVKAG